MVSRWAIVNVSKYQDRGLSGFVTFNIFYIGYNARHESYSGLCVQIGPGVPLVREQDVVEYKYSTKHRYRKAQAVCEIALFARFRRDGCYIDVCPGAGRERSGFVARV